MIKKWTLLASNPAFDSKYISIEKRSYELPNGSVVDDYYHLIRADFVLIIARDLNGKIIIERQYRRGVEDFVYELPAGFINKDEDPVVAAQRELLEETGYEGKAKLLGKIYVQPGYSSQVAYAVLIDIEQTEKHDKELDEDEEIELQAMTLPDIHTMIRKGEIIDMGALSALEIYEKSLE